MVFDARATTFKHLHGAGQGVVGQSMYIAGKKKRTADLHDGHITIMAKRGMKEGGGVVSMRVSAPQGKK